MRANPKAMLVDVARCIGCRACQQACKQTHGMPPGEESVLSADSLTVIEPHGDKFVRRFCMHCQEPACASACPVGALKKTPAGPVVYEARQCIGCRYCMIACPFGVPRYQWSKLVPYVKKCDMCAPRLAAGGVPACVEACPVGATVFGDRDQMLAEAHQRIAQNPAYVRKVYGEVEVGGASVFHITDVPFEELGYVTAPMEQSMPALSASALGEVPTVVLVGGSLLAGLYWFTQRKRSVAAAEHPENESGEERS